MDDRLGAPRAGGRRPAYRDPGADRRIRKPQMTEFDLPPESAPPGPLIRLFKDQRVAFLVVGGINTVVGFGIFIACSQSAGQLVEHQIGKVGASLVTLGITHVLTVLFA